MTFNKGLFIASVFFYQLQYYFDRDYKSSRNFGCTGWKISNL